MSITSPSDSPSGSSKSSDEREFCIVIDREGSLAFMHNDDAYGLLAPAFPQLKTERASHVEPDPDRPGEWLVDMTPLMRRLNTGQEGEYVLVGFSRRDKALAAEQKLVEAMLRGEL